MQNSEQNSAESKSIISESKSDRFVKGDSSTNNREKTQMGHIIIVEQDSPTNKSTIKNRLKQLSADDIYKVAIAGSSYGAGTVWMMHSFNLKKIDFLEHPFSSVLFSLISGSILYSFANGIANETIDETVPNSIKPVVKWSIPVLLTASACYYAKQLK